MCAASKVVWPVFLVALCAAALSPVFAGGLRGLVGLPSPTLHILFPNFSLGGPASSSPNLSSRLGLTRPNISLPAPSGVASSGGGAVALPLWFWFVVLGLAAAGGVALVLLRNGGGGVYDLSASVSLLEEAARRFSSSYGAAKLGALAEYYRRLRELCAKMGLGEEAWEAPSEFLDRVALALGLDRAEARTFAEVFGRSRYSRGLSLEEEEALSGFMAHFLDAVRRRVGVGFKA